MPFLLNSTFLRRASARLLRVPLLIEILMPAASLHAEPVSPLVSSCDTASSVPSLSPEGARIQEEVSSDYYEALLEGATSPEERQAIQRLWEEERRRIREAAKRVLNHVPAGCSPCGIRLARCHASRFGD